MIIHIIHIDCAILCRSLKKYDQCSIRVKLHIGNLKRGCQFMSILWSKRAINGQYCLWFWMVTYVVILERFKQLICFSNFFSSVGFMCCSCQWDNKWRWIILQQTIWCGLHNKVVVLMNQTRARVRFFVTQKWFFRCDVIWLATTGNMSDYFVWMIYSFTVYL